jgi:lambda repressor-like predicted transcriptional regulator
MDMNMDTSIMIPPKNPVERRNWILCHLRNRGWSLTKIAKEQGCSLQAVSNALISASSHLQTRIAEILGLTRQQLFPEYFDTAGNRLGWDRDQHRITRNLARNVEEERAA